MFFISSVHWVESFIKKIERKLNWAKSPKDKTGLKPGSFGPTWELGFVWLIENALKAVINTFLTLIATSSIQVIKYLNQQQQQTLFHLFLSGVVVKGEHDESFNKEKRWSSSITCLIWSNFYRYVLSDSPFPYHSISLCNLLI